MPDSKGKFVCDDYVAEWLIENVTTPVNVTATQVYKDQVLVAYTEFMDPGVYLEGYTLKPQLRFTSGDIKGYIEGDSVPFMAVFNKNQLGGASTINVSIGVDFIDYNSPIMPTYGIDFLTQYWLNPPASPFNTYPNSSAPFQADPGHGTVTNQHRSANIYDEGGKQVVQVWNFTLNFAPGVTAAKVRFGAHLALTDIPNGKLGAAYYPGSALHVRIVNVENGDAG
ncbi:MAG TPA: hypothetical protein ENN25_00895, partial [Euryarchaeota archaeon]|nr:hypothetical protein [Euryarchaeota archaeon]